jgi:hypothetical protein
LKLWRDTLDRLGHGTAGLYQDLAGQDKFTLPHQASATCTPLPLRAVYLLDWGPLVVERLAGMAALRRFVAAATYRGEYLEPMGRLAAHWAACTDVLRGCRAYRLSRPRDWSGLERVLDCIEDENQRCCQEF